jgi:hypothetical protein
MAEPLQLPREPHSRSRKCSPVGRFLLRHAPLPSPQTYAASALRSVSCSQDDLRPPAASGRACTGRRQQLSPPASVERERRDPDRREAKEEEEKEGEEEGSEEGYCGSCRGSPCSGGSGGLEQRRDGARIQGNTPVDPVQNGASSQRNKRRHVSSRSMYFHASVWRLVSVRSLTRTWCFLRIGSAMMAKRTARGNGGRMEKTSQKIAIL